MLNSTSNKCGFRPTTLKDFPICQMACSQTRCFLFENRRACVYENVNRGECALRSRCRALTSPARTPNCQQAVNRLTLGARNTRTIGLLVIIQQ